MPKPTPKAKAPSPKQSKAIVPIAPQPPAIIQPFNGTFTEDQIGLIKRTVCKDATDDELSLFLAVCQRTRLDPFRKQIYSIARRTWNAERRDYDVVRSIQTGIDGFRVIADRTKEVDGQEGPFWCGPEGEWKEVWLDSNLPPVAAKVIVHRKGSRFPFVGVARFDAYAQFYKDDGKWKLTSMWLKMGDVMIAKCAEALALRKGFPEELGELRTTEEMGQAENPDREQLPEKTIEANVVSNGGTVEKIEPVVSPPTPTSWRDVVCHIGPANGKTLGIKLGDMVPAVLRFVRDKIAPTLDYFKPNDAALAAAIKDAQAEGAIPDKKERPVEPAKPETATDTPKTEQKATGGAPESKKAPQNDANEGDKTPLEAKPMAWREVIVDLPMVTMFQGKPLGEVADAKRGQLQSTSGDPKAKAQCDASDGKAWMRTLWQMGIPKLEAKGNLSVKDKILINAIKAGCNEVKAFEDAGWLEILSDANLRKEILRRFDAIGKNEAETDIALGGLLDNQKLAEASEEMLRYIIANWPAIEKAAKEVA